LGIFKLEHCQVQNSSYILTSHITKEAITRRGRGIVLGKFWAKCDSNAFKNRKLRVITKILGHYFKIPSLLQLSKWPPCFCTPRLPWLPQVLAINNLHLPFRRTMSPDCPEKYKPAQFSFLFVLISLMF